MTTVDVASFSHHLRLDADGIWVAGVERPVSYPDDGHDACLSVEDASFWFGHRNRCITAAVRRFLPVDGGPFFDVGAGNGFVARGLAEAGFEVVVVEPGRQGALNARRRKLEHVICSTTDSAGFRSGSLPAVGLFDVIEHVQDDGAFVSSIGTLLADGGLLFATVPAYRLLWSDEDVDAGHFRRYSRAGICGVLTASGFRIEFATYFFRLLPLPILMLRSLPYRLGLKRETESDSAAAARDHGVGRRRLAGALDHLLAGEGRHDRWRGRHGFRRERARRRASALIGFARQATR